jgi:hypothetical protein
MRADVDFILVGGYAVIFHGYSRTTGDLDIWLKPDNFNKEKLKAVLSAQGILHEDIERLTDVDFSKPIAFHIGEPPFRMDFLTYLSGLKYDEAEQGAVVPKLKFSI